MPLLRSIAALALAYVLTSTAVSAQSVTEKASEAQEFLDSGNPLAALEALEEAYGIAWEAIPLTIRKQLFVSDATGYGLYIEREAGNVFAPGEPLVLYLEPLGFGYGRDALGNRELRFAVDLVLRDNAGEQIFVRENFMQLGQPLRYENREFFLTLTFNLNGLPAGEYTADLVIRDEHSDKSAELTEAFVIAE